MVDAIALHLPLTHGNGPDLHYWHVGTERFHVLGSNQAGEH